jgi:hypothetical protein
MQKYSFSFYQSPVKSRIHKNSTIQLANFIQDIKDGKYAKQIRAVRASTGIDQERLKNNLPYATISGIFEEGKRDAKSLITHSGLLQIDIDKKGQDFNLQELKKRLAQDPLVLSVFVSPRGHGLKVIVKIDKEGHSQAFLSLESYFMDKYSVSIDKACKDVCRPFFVSYDPDIYFNPSSMEFTLSGTTAATNGRVEKIRDIEILCDILTKQKIDITNQYASWRDIGFAIANGLGESGRTYFHRISEIYPGYSKVEADKQYDACSRNTTGARKWESLFGIAKDHGIVISNNGQVKTDPAPPPGNKSLPVIIQVENFLNDRYDFRKNLVNEKVEYKRKDAGAEWIDANENEISRLLEHNYFKFSPAKTASLLNSDFVPSYNPIIKYFEKLSYDPKKEPSYIDFLCSKVKAKDQARFNKHFRKMLIRCVACSTSKEVSNTNFNKHVFVIINRAQTIGKSSFCRWLCPPDLKEYFVENISMDKDGMIALATSFIINLDELASLSKYDINQLKAKISMASINERLPYGRMRKFYPRRANFFGSTNNDEFLNDDTGNARWICFEIDGFEKDFWIPGSSNFIDINKVWAEAKFLYDSGITGQLSAEDKKENDEMNRNYEERSIEEEMIITSFELDPAKEEINFITTTEVLAYLVSIKSANPNKVSLKKIGSVIKKLGFLQGTMRKGAFPVKGYYMKKLLQM